MLRFCYFAVLVAALLVGGGCGKGPPPDSEALASVSDPAILTPPADFSPESLDAGAATPKP